MPELIKRVSDDLNPWQPTFDADSAIEEIRQQVYPKVIEVFENKDPLFAPVSTVSRPPVFTAKRNKICRLLIKLRTGGLPLAGGQWEL